MFGDQKPKPDQVAGGFVGKKLSYPTFQAGRITGFDAFAFLGRQRLDR